MWGTGNAKNRESLEVLNRLSRQVGLAAAFTLSGSFQLSGMVDFEAYNTILATGLGQIHWMSEAMADLVTLLREVPEPKYMVYFSEGVPTEFLQNEVLRTRAINAMEPMIRAFNATGWGFQAIDIEGIEDPMRGSGIDAGEGEFRHREDVLMDFRPLTSGFAHKRGPGFDAQSLFYPAGETGGEVIENFSYLHQATEVVLQLTSVTCLLAFQPTDVVADSRSHELEVRLTDSSNAAVVRHRSAYRAPKPVLDRTLLEWGLAAAELVTSDRAVADFPAEVLVYPLPVTSGLQIVPLVIQVPGRNLISSASGSRFRIGLQAIAFGDDDSLLDLLDQQIQIDTEKVGPALEQTGLRFEGSLNLPPGRRRVRVILRLMDTGERFLTTVPLRIAGPELEDPVLLQPVFVRRSSSYVTVRQAPSPAAPVATAVPGPFSIGSEDLIPILSPEIESLDDELILLTAFSNDGSAPDLSVRVRDGAGSEVAGGTFKWLVRDPDGGDGATRLLGLFRPTGLDPGRYGLEMSLEGPEGQSPAARSASFTVAAAAD